MDTCFHRTDKLMEAQNNWFAHRLWKVRTCFGLLLCKNTVLICFLSGCALKWKRVWVFFVCLSACSQATIRHSLGMVVRACVHVGTHARACV